MNRSPIIRRRTEIIFRAQSFPGRPAQKSGNSMAGFRRYDVQPVPKKILDSQRATGTREERSEIEVLSRFCEREGQIRNYGRCTGKTQESVSLDHLWSLLATTSETTGSSRLDYLTGLSSSDQNNLHDTFDLVSRTFDRHFY